jgi:hypothetical protein
MDNNEYYIKMYGNLANRGVEEWDAKVAKIKEFFRLLLCEVIFSEVLIIWVMWILLTH